jgi:hypothetical protein
LNGRLQEQLYIIFLINYEYLKGSKIIGKLRGGKASRERILDSPHYCMHGMGFFLFLREKRLT